MTAALPPEQPVAPLRFLRSVRLERDAQVSGALAGYTITTQARAVLRRMLGALGAQGTERAWTLTGPYGSGKSAFALFLTRLLQVPEGEAFELLQEADPLLADEWRLTTPRPFLPVALTLRRAPLGTALLEGLQAASLSLNGAASEAWRKNLKALNQGVSPDTRALLEQFESLQALAAAEGYGGLLLVLDELGKALEYAGRFEGEDIYLLQELAEVAARSGEHPLLLVGVLHQAFEHYGEHLIASSRKEWAKVQGRFADIAFLEPPEQQMRLAAQAMEALEVRPSGPLLTQAEQAAEGIAALGQAPRALGGAEFLTLSRAAAPLHPTVLLALPYLFRRFAQNERSLFAYLLSGEPRAVPDLWPARSALVRLADLFDYFALNLLGSLSRQAFARRWLEVVDAVERHPDLSEVQVETLKTVGLLGVLGDVSMLVPSAELISLALRDTPDDPEVARTLQELEHRSLIVYRRFNRTFRVWEGSDVDIEERLEEGRRTVGAQLALSEILERYLPRRPLVARRHSFDTGALRFFEVRYLDEPADPARLTPAAGADGILVCTLPGTPEQGEAFARWAHDEALCERPELVVVIPEQIHSLREAATELRALHWLRESTPELRDDRVARREVAERLSHLEALLVTAVEQLLDPRPAPQGSRAAYHHLGERVGASTPRQVTELLSSAVDAVYPQSPRVLNELVNRRTLSSAAAAARRTLIERMLTQANEPLLGIEGYPPERSMYESVLRATGLHAPLDPDEEEGGWQFQDPEEGHPTNLAPVWAWMAERIFGTAEPLAVDALFAEMAAPPYGVTAGLQPVLLAAFMQAHPHEISLYREAAFVPEPGIADFEVLLRRPELFAVAGSAVRGERADVLERLASSLNTPEALVPVVRHLIRMVKGLPDTSWRTGRLPAEVLALRGAFERARSPEKLLFADIPAALGLPAIEDGPGDPARTAAFFDALNGAIRTWAAHGPQQTAQARATLLEALNFPPTDEGWQALTEQAQELQGRPLPASLVPLVSRLCSPGKPETVQDGVLALVAGRSPRSWTDADADRFPTQALATAQTYSLAARQLGYSSPEAERASERYAQSLRASLGLSGGGPSMPGKHRDAMKLALLRLLQELDAE
ncbi:hypothetical protein SAMN04488058_1455 [Deinococcus reticulitermitis]|uniref:ATP-binding protein n=1 Tax=Deinococcus reticulitermitis TaxID=856736 RepID=A0A1H7CWH1_9DEIO|nr:hypothetical protein [Deinococcus reticulitermitis]SEJ94008.1 hypothetical protein SAMN04488058_1455 [Deinococcus reticulitermitis]